MWRGKIMASVWNTEAVRHCKASTKCGLDMLALSSDCVFNTSTISDLSFFVEMHVIVCLTTLNWQETSSYYSSPSPDISHSVMQCQSRYGPHHNRRGNWATLQLTADRMASTSRGDCQKPRPDGLALSGFWGFCEKKWNWFVICDQAAQ
jgi:hypothetical protein